MQARKMVDNQYADSKLELRRYFLGKYHAEPPRVMDCCQGNGVMWRSLQREFKLASYWGMDLKPKRGRLQADSLAVLAAGKWRDNVIDVDTYGNPWKHWLALLPHVTRPTTVFLTHGMNRMGGGLASIEGLAEAGIRFRNHGLFHNKCPVPHTILLHLYLSGILQRYLIAEAERFGIDVVEARVAERCGGQTASMNYYGIHLKPS